MNSSTEQISGSSFPGALPAVGGALLGLAASTASSDGAVFFTDVTSGGTISTLSTFYFDLGEGGGGGSWSVGLPSPAGTDFQLFFGLPFNGIPESAKPRISGNGNNGIAVQSGYVAKLGAGTTIDSGLNWVNFADIATGNYGGSWSPGTEALIGLRLGSGSSALYGWADLEYTSGSQLTLHSFAVETTPGTAIQAGVVPEPEETALVMALVAGSAALYRRRQQAKNA